MVRLDKRTLFFNARSLEKFGEENIKTLELDEAEKLIIFRPFKSKAMAVFNNWFNIEYPTRIVIYDFMKKEVEFNKLFSERIPLYPSYPISVSDEFDICIGNKILKYNKELKDYEKIEIGNYNPLYVYWTRKPIKAYIFSLWPNNALIIYDKQTDDLTYYENIVTYFFNEPIILEKEKKVYVDIAYGRVFNGIREIDLTNGEYVDYYLPFYIMTFIPLPNPLRFYVVKDNGEIAYYNPETEETEILIKFPEDVYPGGSDYYVYPDIVYKRFFFLVRARPNLLPRALIVYNIEKNTSERVGLFEEEIISVKPTKHKNIVIIYDFGYRLCNCKVVDIKKKQILTTLYSDDVFYASEDVVDVL